VRVLAPAAGRQGTGILMRSREGAGEGVKGPRRGGGETVCALARRGSAEPGEGAPELTGAVRSQVRRRGNLSSPERRGDGGDGGGGAGVLCNHSCCADKSPAVQQKVLSMCSTYVSVIMM
jgi:hypothetical protein